MNTDFIFIVQMFEYVERKTTFRCSSLHSETISLHMMHNAKPIYSVRDARKRHLSDRTEAMLSKVIYNKPS